MARKKSSKTFDKPLISKDFWLKKLVRGDYSLGESFWLFWHLPLFFYTIAYLSVVSNDSWESGFGIFFSIIIFIYLPYIVCAMIGTWNSASKYKAKKIKNKQSYGWATATYVYIVIAVIRKVSFIFKSI